MPMVNLSDCRMMGVTVAAVMLTGLLAGCAGSSSFDGCTARDEQLETVLAKTPILEAHPPSAASTDKYSECDLEDGYASAGQRYRTDMERQDILTFYSKAATADGWRPDESEPLLTGPPPAGLVTTASAACFTKEIDGTSAYLSVSFPSDLNIAGVPELQAPPDVYSVEVTGSHDRFAWCS
jgi:hypothetical protein